MTRLWVSSLEAWLPLVALLSAGCRRAPPEGAAPAPSASEGAARALLELDRTRHDFGQVAQGDELKTSFRLRNAGQRLLTLDSDGSRAQTCTAKASPSELPSGSSGDLAVTCRAELYGPLRVFLPVRSNDARDRELELTAEVTPLLAFDRELVELTMPFGEERSVSVGLRGARAAAARLELQAEGSAGFRVKGLPSEPGSPARLELRYAGRAVGRVTGNLLFRTQLATPSEIRLPYSVRVEGTLSVAPTNPYFNLRNEGSKTLYIEVDSKQPGFRVAAVSVRDGPFTAAVEPRKAGGPFRVKVSVLEARLADEARSALGTLEIRSNDVSEPLRSVPLLAFGRLNRSASGAGER